AATTEAPPRPLSRRGRIPGCVYQPELVTLALCLRGKARPFWIILFLVVGLRDHQVIHYSPHNPSSWANHQFRLWAKTDIKPRRKRSTRGDAEIEGLWRS